MPGSGLWGVGYIFCLFRLSLDCMPSFKRLQCLELVKKFVVEVVVVVVVVVGGVDTNYSVKLLLKLNNI